MSKKKEKKPKSVVLSPGGFSKVFESFYNNKKNSDMTFKFEENNETIPAHKVFLSAHSDYFENNLVDNTFIFTKRL